MNSATITPRSPRINDSRIRGFTLVEMMIALALVLLMMTLFAEIFQIAAGSLSRQRSLAENDQRARMLNTIIRGDLDKRTFVSITPLSSSSVGSSVGGQSQGYWYYAENNPGDDTDDVLCFTVDSKKVGVNSDTLPYTGKATPLGTNQSEPDFDDGIPPSNPSPISTNFSGQSRTAEVAYFLRGGNLYRRVLLIRDGDQTDSQPHNTNGQRPAGLIPTYSLGSGSFYNDFDYSAFYFRGKYSTNPSPALNGGGVHFHNRQESLSNDANPESYLAFDSTPAAPLQPQDQFRYISLGIPQTRFGHDPWTGLPREFAGVGGDGYAGTSDDTDFIGRFTSLESANGSFGYPGYLASIPQMNRPDLDQSPVSTNVNLVLNNNTKVVTAFSGAPIRRRGEDILMSNVLTFDVKVWDSSAIDPASGSAGRFVDLGDTSSSSFAPGNVQNSIYSPFNQFRYDTWHPRAEAIYPPDPTQRNTSPPFTTPISAVQITVNYRDPSGEQVRQVTIVQSLTPPN